MNKAWLLLTIDTYSAAPEADLVGHPWNIILIAEKSPNKP
jgi:hypothetical protein